jgi:hypothetical protein
METACDPPLYHHMPMHKASRAGGWNRGLLLEAVLDYEKKKSSGLLLEGHLDKKR